LDQTTVDQFNDAKNANKDNFDFLLTYTDPELTVEEFDLVNQRDWFMPTEYKTMDIESFLVDQCPKQNYERLIEEIQLFRQHNMTDLLRYLKYLVDTMRENNIVWGVGRGSSVASYCLYLIGVHRIDSIKYNLDIKEFLK
jgi:DNA polymerase III alpha subunit